jgi:hypothetical protein
VKKKTPQPPRFKGFEPHFVERDEDYSYHLQYDGAEVVNPPTFTQNMNCVGDPPRTVYGVPWSDILAGCRCWWNRTGRHLTRRHNPKIVGMERRDAALLAASGILRGEPFEHLDEREISRLLDTYEREKVRPEHREAILEWMQRNDSVSLDPERLSIYQSLEDSLRNASAGLVNPPPRRLS